MITISMSPVDREIAALVRSFGQLEPRIRNKHLKAAVGRAAKPHVGDLRRVTPPVGTRRGRRKKGQKRKSSGALRRSVRVRTKSKKDAAFAVLGYKAGPESRKAIWLEFGTNKGIAPRGMVANLMSQIGPQVQARLPAELKIALERAVREVASGRNPGG
jgi:hypothetical protein